MKKLIWLVLPALLTAPLSGQTIYPLDSLHVNAASRITVAGTLRSVDIIDRDAIERLPAHSLGDIIARALGADILARSPMQADISLRGSTTEQVAVLVDGVPVNDTQTGHFHLDQPVPLDDVERIEVLRGTASSVHGAGAVGGIVNIVTRRGAPALRASARLEGGTFGTIRGAARAGIPLTHATPVSLSAEHARSDGHRPGTDYESTVARASLAHAVAGGTFRLSGGIADRSFGAADFYGPFPTSHEKTRVITGDAAFERSIGRIALEPRVSIRRHDDDFVLRREDPSFYRNIHETTDAGGALTARASAGPVMLAAGGEAFRSSIESTNLGDHDETRTAMFGEAVTARDAYTLSAGARFDHSSTYGGFFSPSIAAGLRIDEHVRLRASAARGFRAPTWTDRYYSDPANLGDSTLNVERAWTYEGGVDLLPGGAWSVDATAFVRHVDNAIDWVRPESSPTGPWRIVNVQTAKYRGLELRVRNASLLGIDWTARGSLLSFDATSTDTLMSKYALRPLQETASLEAAIPLPFGLSAAVRGSHARRTGEASYHLLDAQIRYRLGQFSAYIGETNLGYQSYVDVSGANAAGRAFTAGGEWRTGSD
ncbi:MAG TPA: TonB-dependent receptor [Longimicrobiales bacterium]